MLKSCTTLTSFIKTLPRSLDIHLERIEMLNTAPEMIAGLAGLIREKAKEAGWL
jgi:protoheme ferro-lyase